jgi:uroporphyrinogen decarboxylase
MKKFLSVLNGDKAETPPAWFMRQAGRYLPEYREVRAKAGGFWGMVYNPEYAAEVTLQPIRRFGFDAAIIFSDILVVPHALGQHIEFMAGEGPKLDAIKSMTDISMLKLDNIASHCAPVFETVARTKAGLDDNTALIGFAGAPFTVAAYMLEGEGSRDFAKAKAFAYSNPDAMARLLNILVDATAEYLVAQVHAGAEVLQLFDSWAGILNEADFARWVIIPTAKLVAKIRAAGVTVPIIGFPRGASFAAVRYVAETGVTALQLDTSFHVAEAQKLAKTLPVQGWLDPVALLAGGVEMERAARSMIDAMQGLPYIFNLGHGIIKETPPEHVAKLVGIIRS